MNEFCIGLKMNCSNCEIFPKAFSRSADLKTHVAEVHEKIKPFKCTLCSYASSRSVDLKYHISTVHEKERKHICDLCDKEYRRSSHQ